LNKITLPSAGPKSIGIQKEVFLGSLAHVNKRTWWCFFEKKKKNCQHSFTPPRKSCYGKLVLVKEAEGIFFSQLCLICSSSAISSCK